MIEEFYEIFVKLLIMALSIYIVTTIADTNRKVSEIYRMLNSKKREE